MPTRTPQQIFQHHAEALGAEDLDAIVADYSDDAFFMTPAGVLPGKAGIRQAFTKLLSVGDGIDTFVFKDGFIRAQTVRYTLQKK